MCDCQSQQRVEESPARTMSTDRNSVRSTARPAVRKRNSLYERGRKMLGWLRGELHPLEHSYLLMFCLFVSVLSLTHLRASRVTIEGIRSYIYCLFHSPSFQSSSVHNFYRFGNMVHIPVEKKKAKLLGRKGGYSFTALSLCFFFGP